jgi:nitrile hydratase subunit alpha
MTEVQPTKSHDVAGLPLDDPIMLEEHPLVWWEKEIDALLVVLVKKGLFTVNLLRNGIESLSDDLYKNLSYYEKWAISITKGLTQTGVITAMDLDQALGSPPETDKVLFSVGDRVQVRHENFATKWIKPHLRTPGYLFGKIGVVERICGVFENPETAVYRVDTTPQALYRVRFLQKDLWPDYLESPDDTIEVEIYQHWLVPPNQEPGPNYEQNVLFNPNVPHHDHDHDHDHDHGDHDHTHEQRTIVEQNAVNNEPAPGSVQYLSKALITTLLNKGLVTREAIRFAIEFRDAINAEPKGAKIVAKAWSDPEFKKRLLANGRAAVGELGFQSDVPLIIVENVPNVVHNVVVCTLCSCYPRQILGIPPGWYKDRSYRARVPREPRAVLKEFGTIIDPSIKVCVHDSTADMRYFVLPARPEGTEDWTEEQLEAIVTRDSLIGVTIPKIN